MKICKTILCFLLPGILCLLFSCTNNKDYSGNAVKAKNKITELMCSLSSPELQQRKETVIASLQKQIKETKELENGYAFKFDGSDALMDELNEFIKTERTCCAFFVFGLSVSGDKSEIWLEITGPEGTKDFIKDELAFI